VVSYGEDVYKAFFRMETVEHYAKISVVTELLGGPQVLPETEVRKLLESRTRYGVKAASAGEIGCPLAAESVAKGDKIWVTREELIAMIDEALRARGVA
jgi:L-fuculose-phosphate aldolase